MLFFFFFQAEDGIRDGRVTGVQTCALPICINQKGLVALRLAKIDIGKRSSIDKQIETRRPQFLVQLIEIREVQLRMIKTHDVEPFSIFAHERSAKPPAGAENCNFHSSAAALYERRSVFSIGGS